MSKLLILVGLNHRLLLGLMHHLWSEPFLKVKGLTKLYRVFYCFWFYFVVMFVSFMVSSHWSSNLFPVSESDVIIVIVLNNTTALNCVNIISDGIVAITLFNLALMSYIKVGFYAGWMKIIVKKNLSELTLNSSLWFICLIGWQT